MNKLQNLTTDADLATMDGWIRVMEQGKPGALRTSGGTPSVTAEHLGAAVLAGPSPVKPRAKFGAISRNVRVFAMRSREELVEHTLHLLEREGSAAKVHADWAKLTKFVDACSSLYHQNPYHNWHHAVDVTHTMAWMLTRPLFREQLPPADSFWLLIASIAHDLDHPGHNNQWEINIHSPRASKYNNLAVLEHHSLDLAAEMIAQPEMRFTETMNQADQKRGRDLMRDLILATDFAIHKDFLTAFGAALRDYPARRGFQDPDFVMMVLKALIKAADIANTTKPFAQAKMWGLRVMEEFWAQGRLEKAQSFPVGPLNDEERVDLNQAQAGFIRFAAMDLFDYLSALEPGMKVLVKALNENVSQYQSMPAKAQSGTSSPAQRAAKS
jgi:3'5'-cyclic nucleotide phosphodiesterase